MLDDLDRALIPALHLDVRASFSRIAEGLGVSARTVARRYRRLRTEAGLRVVGLADPHRGGPRAVAGPADGDGTVGAGRRRGTRTAAGHVLGQAHLRGHGGHGGDPRPGRGRLRQLPTAARRPAYRRRHRRLRALSAAHLPGRPPNWRRSAQALDAERQAALEYRRSAEGVRQPGAQDAGLPARAGTGRAGSSASVPGPCCGCRCARRTWSGSRSRRPPMTSRPSSPRPPDAPIWSRRHCAAIRPACTAVSRSGSGRFGRSTHWRRARCCARSRRRVRR